MKKLLYLTVLSLCAFMINLAPAMAQIADQPCDTRYWNQLSSRAWMEAEREIMQNQNLIFKADSVLEYTCFDQFVSIAAWEAGQIFVHSNYFGSNIIPYSAPEAMPNAMANVISNALNAYRSGNFSHTFLGGRSDRMSIANSNSSFVPATTRVGYTCQNMSNVWRTAKCANFIDNGDFADTDGFYPFEDLAGYNGGPNVAGYETINETRQWPSDMACGASVGVGGPWSNQISLAANSSNTLYPFQTPLNQIYEDVNERLSPGNCAAVAPIPTGITVYNADGESHADAVCTKPGCIYNRNSTVSADIGTCIATAISGTPSSITTSPPVTPSGAGSAGGG